MFQTGRKAYSWLIEVNSITGIPTGNRKPNVPTDPDYISPITDYNTCGVVTWEGINPVCQTGNSFTWIGQNPICEIEPTCSNGYQLSQDRLSCIKILSQSPIITQFNYCVASVTLDQWIDAGTRVYKLGHSQEVDWDMPSSEFELLDNIPQWKSDGLSVQGPMNRSAVWIDSDCNGLPDPIITGTQVTLSTIISNTQSGKVVYVGVSGDNQFTLNINGRLVAKQAVNSSASFKIFHIFPVELSSGVNYFNIVGVGDGTTGDGISMIIYDNTEQELMAAIDDSQLNIIFNSRSLIGTPINVASCSEGWVLDVEEGINNYVCRRILTESPTQSNTGYKAYQNRERSDGFVEPNTTSGGIGPYIPPVYDINSCPLPIN